MTSFNLHKSVALLHQRAVAPYKLYIYFPKFRNQFKTLIRQNSIRRITVQLVGLFWDYFLPIASPNTVYSDALRSPSNRLTIQCDIFSLDHSQTRSYLLQKKLADDTFSSYTIQILCCVLLIIVNYIAHSKVLNILLLFGTPILLSPPKTVSYSTQPPRQPSGRVLALSAGGPGFNPQSMTAFSVAQWYSAGFECRRSRAQSPVKDRVIPKTLLKWYQQFPCLALKIKKGNTGSFSRIKIGK